MMSRMAWLIALGMIAAAFSANAAEIGLIMTDMTLKAQDGKTLAGSWIIPENAKKKAPVVLLVHDYGLNRRDWNVFIPDLVEQGFAVLAMDLRGHGQSRANEGEVVPTQDDLLKIGLADIQSALKWAAAQKAADAKRIGIVGAGLGGDLAFLARTAFVKNIRAAVVISPSYTTITDGTFSGMTASGILFCASSKSKDGMSMMAADTLANFTKEPKKVVIYDSAAHGLAIFYKHPEVKQDILSWLNVLKKN